MQIQILSLLVAISLHASAWAQRPYRSSIEIMNDSVWFVHDTTYSSYKYLEDYLNSVRLYNVKFEGKTTIQTRYTLDNFNMIKCKGDTLVARINRNLNVSYSNLKSLYIKGTQGASFNIDYPSTLSFLQDTIKELSLSDLVVKEILLFESVFHVVRFRESYILGESRIFFQQLPEVLDLSQLEVDSSGSLNIEYYYTTSKKCKLILDYSDIERINLRYLNFKLDVNGSKSPDEKMRTFELLLKKFKSEGRMESYENLDKDFKEFKYLSSKTPFGRISNFIDRYWWGYGYTKLLVIPNSFAFHFVFFVLNSLIYTRLITFGYPIQRFVEIENHLKRKYIDRPNKLFYARMPYIFLYTGYIFWGLKLDVNNINIHHLGLFMYVLVQYLVGVVCLAYIANFIITV